MKKKDSYEKIRKEQTEKDKTLTLKEAVYFAGMMERLTVQNDEELEKMSVFAEQLDVHIRYGKKELLPLFDFVVEKIANYEASQEGVPREELTDGVDVLGFLMDQHGHRLKDLSDVAPASVISEILHRKRKLNRGHIEKLSAKYHVSPAVFFNPPRTK